MALGVAREIFFKAGFSWGGQMYTAYDKTSRFLLKYYDEKLALLFLANKIERELAIDRTFTPTGISGSYHHRSKVDGDP